MKCDFCHKIYEGKHRCSCGDCNKDHPICNECYNYYVSTGKIKARDSYDTAEKYT